MKSLDKLHLIDTGIDYTHADPYLNIWLNPGEIPNNLGLVDTDGDTLITFRDLNNVANTGAVRDVNANGRIPVLELDDGTCLPESNAIVWYLADGTKFLPADKLARAQALQWMCFEQYQLEPGVATVRFWLMSLKKTPEELGERYKERFQRGAEALAVLERVRSAHPFELVVLDLDREADADKRAAYDWEVPVVELDGRKIMKYHVDEARLVRLLALTDE